VLLRRPWLERRGRPFAPCLAGGESQGRAGMDESGPACQWHTAARRTHSLRSRTVTSNRPVREADRAAIRPAGPRRQGVLLVVGFLGQARNRLARRAPRPIHTTLPNRRVKPFRRTVVDLSMRSASKNDINRTDACENTAPMSQYLTRSQYSLPPDRAPKHTR